MPIRFRCAYCNQLLGIARRKAGTVVRCPGCSGQVVVPSLEEAGLGEDKRRPAPAVFEGNEIDKMLEEEEQPSVVQPGPGPVFASQAAGAPPPGPQAGAPGRPPVPGAGIWLSPAKATLLSVGVVVALAIAFGSGLLVGLLLALRK
jgi:phage FluMu protein Com